MSGEEIAFANALRAHPADEVTRLVYADWLDERGDPRGPFLRLRHELLKVGPDHVQRFAAECELSKLRKGLDPEWLIVAEPERAHLFRLPKWGYRVECSCINDRHTRCAKITRFHLEPQDTECDAWLRLCDEVEDAIRDCRQEFRPLDCLDLAEWRWIVALPPAIRQLTAVRSLRLYGSSLVRIPVEIGEMENLSDFLPYTSYRLHWYPFELLHNPHFSGVSQSTRAMYGNYKYRPPFPLLACNEPQFIDWPAVPRDTTRPCSVCRKPFVDRRRYRAWISLKLADYRDVLPLLVNACSRECVANLPSPPEGYHPQPHRGGMGTPRRF